MPEEATPPMFTACGIAVVLAALMAPLSLAAAAPIHKCIINGSVTYQSDPCPSGDAGKRPTVEQLNAEQRKRQLQAGDATVSPSTPAPLPSAKERPTAAVTPVQPPAASFKCDGRKTCSQMTSCAEAKYFLAHCPGVTMDGDGNGIPCERQWCNK